MSALPFAVLCFGISLSAAALLTRFAPTSLLNRAPGSLLGAIALVAVVGALFAPDRPTGLRVLDAVLRGLLACAFVLGASAAPPRHLLLACGVIAVPIALAAADARVAPWVVAAAASAFGLGASATASSVLRDVPVFGAVLGGLAAQGALRLPATLPARMPSLFALCALLLVIGGPFVRLSSVWRRRLALSFGMICALMVACGVAGSFSLLRARHQVEQGISAAKSGLRLARGGDTTAADTQFGVARTALGDVRDAMDGPMALVGRVVPVLAQHITTVHDLTAVATEVVDAAQKTASDVDLQSLRADGGRFDLARMTALRAQVEQADVAITRARAALLRADGPWLVGPVTRRITSLRTEVDDAAKSTADVRRILDVVPVMLGANGPRRYLLVTPTPAEARGSGGVIGNYGEITAVDGKLALVKFGRNTELNSGGTPGNLRYLQAPADFVSRYTRFGAAVLWQNVNMSPDFPSSAQAMAGLYPQSGGQPVDGVISVDPLALASFLEVLGPVQVASWPDPITTTNAARVLMLEAYVAKGGGTQDRYDLLADVAQAVWGKLAGVSLPSPKELAAQLAPSVRERHLQMWMRGKDEEDYLTSIGLAGNVAPIAGDSFGAIVNNASGNKIEYFLKRRLTYDARVDPSAGTVTATATISLRNDSPSVGLPDYIIANQAPGLDLPNGTNRMYVSVYSPLQLTGATAGGAPLQLTAETELGRNVYSGWVVIPSQGEMQVIAQFAGPVPGGIKTGYRLDIVGQPMVNPDEVTVHVTAKNGTPVAGENLAEAGAGGLIGVTGSGRLRTFVATFK